MIEKAVTAWLVLVALFIGLAALGIIEPSEKSGTTAERAR